jgi:epoxyqueuosine reductase
MVIGHLLSTEDLVADQPAEPRCGRCRACMDACPTDAIREPFVVDSRRCIAYHTIENRDEQLPDLIKAGMGPWVAGCDICQDVCPFNQTELPTNQDPEVQPRPWVLDLSAAQVKQWDPATWDQKLRGSALRRIKPWMWRRNAASAKSVDPPTVSSSEIR